IDADSDPGVRAAAAWAARGRRDVPMVAAALNRARGAAQGAVAENANAARADATGAVEPKMGSGFVVNRIQSTAWIRVRLIAPDGSPVARRWVRLRAGSFQIWALTDDDGEASLRDLPAGPYRLSMDATDQLALTAAIASGKSPATTPVGP
ncbi:MAG: hypothetical protein H7X95_04540, partial [Deltaproteobacteria bacterium]|nr:hypothetical protein [Deltaproteobacteria bacterium]